VYHRASHLQPDQTQNLLPLTSFFPAGKPVAYKLVGAANPLVYAHPRSMIGQRAQFAFKNLWVTPHSDCERYPAGDYTIGSRGGAGLSEWTKQVNFCRWLTGHPRRRFEVGWGEVCGGGVGEGRPELNPTLVLQICCPW